MVQALLVLYPPHTFTAQLALTLQVIACEGVWIETLGRLVESQREFRYSVNAFGTEGITTSAI